MIFTFELLCLVHHLHSAQAGGLMSPMGSDSRLLWWLLTGASPWDTLLKGTVQQAEPHNSPVGGLLGGSSWP